MVPSRLTLTEEHTGEYISTPTTFSLPGLDAGGVPNGIFIRRGDNASKRCQINSHNYSKRLKTQKSVNFQSLIFTACGTYSVKYLEDKEGRKFLFTRPNVSSEPEYGDFKREECPNFDRLSLQNRRRENLDNTIQECIAQSGLCVFIDKGGMYVLGNYKSEKKMYCIWKPPKKESYAIETDGSFKDKQEAGSSVFIIRDCTGLVVYAHSSVYKKYKSSIEYEVVGIFNGVEQAFKMGIKRVEVRSDCKSLIEAINGTSNVPPNVKFIIESINREKKNFESIEFYFVHRGVNRAADSLSHFQARDIGTEKEWLLPEGGLRVRNSRCEDLPKSVIYHCEQDEKGSPQKKQKKKK